MYGRIVFCTCPLSTTRSFDAKEVQSMFHRAAGYRLYTHGPLERDLQGVDCY
jgi:hypothetical protein